MNKIDLFKADLNVARKLRLNKSKENCILPMKIKGDSILILSNKKSIENEAEIEFLYVFIVISTVWPKIFATVLKSTALEINKVE